MNTGFRPDFTKQVFKDNYGNKKELKIIDLNWEHFEDILMILNEKSPVAIKVKSKKAELFFLQKTEAIEISNRYSNIWKRIVNRSLHNMKQIKNLIRKKVSSSSMIASIIFRLFCFLILLFIFEFLVMLSWKKYFSFNSLSIS